MSEGSSSERGRSHLRRRRQARLRNLWETTGAELFEFALMLPFLLVFLVGIIDFGQAWNLKQKLNNAAREGARFNITENQSDLTQTDPSSINATQNVVVNYLVAAKVTSSTSDVCGMTTSTTPDTGGTITSGWTFTSSNNCPGTSGKFVLKIEPGYSYANGSTTVSATRVTLTFPYNWNFSRIIGFLVSGASPGLPSTISSDAIMENLPGT